MGIHYTSSENSTNLSGKIGFLTLTVATFAFSGFTEIQQGFHALDENMNSPSLTSSDAPISIYSWEALLKGSDSSGNGGEDLYIGDSSDFNHIYSFAYNLLTEQSEISAEFDKVFADNFWDILA